MKIGVTNFRIFKNRQEFDIKPITLLTGPNNSGKSALTKLLELLKQDTTFLNYTDGRHNLGSFDNSINFSSPKKEFKIDFSSDVLYLSRNMLTEITYRESAAKEIKVFSDKTEVFKYKIFDRDLKETQSDTFSQTDEAHNFSISFNYKFVLKEFFKKNIDVKSDWDGDKFIYKKLAAHTPVSPKITFETYNDLAISADLVPDISETSYDPEFGTGFKVPYIDKRYFTAAYLINNVIDNRNIENSFALYDIYINSQNVTKEYANMLIRSQDNVFNNFSSFIPEISSEKNLEALIDYAGNALLREIHEDFLDDLVINTEFTDNDKLELVENDLFRILFREKIIDFGWFSKSSGKTFFQQFLTQPKDLQKSLSEVDFISAQRGTTERVLLNKGSFEMNSVLLNFQKVQKDGYSVHHKFINESFNIFGIAGELKIKSFENTIMVPYILKDGKEISFADLGFGFAQIVPIILKIAMSRGAILIIEEPEANLHPNLQSKLADFFVLAANTFENLRLIIETHSEYIIRKLQYLTAKKAVAPDKTAIYYFNSNVYVTKSEPKVKHIKIGKTGALTEEFGPGFYDEAIRLRFDLMKLNSEQLN